MAANQLFDGQSVIPAGQISSNPSAEQFSTFGDTTNQFGGTVNEFEGVPGTMSQTVQDAVTNPGPTEANPYQSGFRGDTSSKLAEWERKSYKEFHDDYFSQYAAKKAYDQKRARDRMRSDGDDGIVNYIQPFYWRTDTVPDWVLGKGVDIPEGSNFRNPANTGAKQTQVSPYQAWFEFRQKYKENPDYDMYTGEYHKDYYPQEWIDMARYWDYRAKN